MAKVNIRKLRNYLESLSEEELQNEVVDLFNIFTNVKKYYQIQLTEDREELLEKYKKIVKDEFLPERGFGKARLSVARKAVMDYKKINDGVEEQVNLMIFYVEIGVDYTRIYGDINEAFYNSMESMYQDALELTLYMTPLLVTVHTTPRYQDKIANIVPNKKDHFNRVVQIGCFIGCYFNSEYLYSTGVSCRERVDRKAFLIR